VANDIIQVGFNHERNYVKLYFFVIVCSIGFADFLYNLPMVQDVSKMKDDLKTLSQREDALLRFSGEALL